jgi:hypothetical protein
VVCNERPPLNSIMVMHWYSKKMLLEKTVKYQKSYGTLD